MCKMNLSGKKNSFYVKIFHISRPKSHVQLCSTEIAALRQQSFIKLLKRKHPKVVNKICDEINNNWIAKYFTF